MLFQATGYTPGHELSLWVTSPDQDTLKRWFGCLIMLSIPQEGIHEAFLALKDIWEFRAEPPIPAIPQAAAGRGIGKVIGTVERPDLVI